MIKHYISIWLWLKDCRYLFDIGEFFNKSNKTWLKADYKKKIWAKN